MPITILGISAFYHDSAACLVRDGEIIAAAQEERFTREKHDASFPKFSIEYCLQEGGITPRELDYVGFYDKPLLKFERILENYLAVSPRGYLSFITSMPSWVKKKLFTREIIRRELDNYRGPIFFPEHHESHAASAFYPSPFEKAAILTIDGVGEWATSSYGTGEGNNINLLAELHYPHSLGLLYSAFTYYVGFKVNSGEYKLMGLAAYGEPKYANLILDKLLDLKEDGSFRLNMRYFNYPQGLTMTNEAFDKLFGGVRRESEGIITKRYMDIAASIQKVIEEVILRIVRHLFRETGVENLCLAGGVALNCVSNSRILKEGPFKRLWIQPASGDAGGALGVALLIHHKTLGHGRAVLPGDSMRGSLLGPSYSEEEIEKYLNSVDAQYKKMSPKKLVRRTAELIANGKVVGWFQGRMEFGPRALGSRSILGDPRSKGIRFVMNEIKCRETFRPFAPSVLKEYVSDYFKLNSDSPYMLLVASIQEHRRVQISGWQRSLSGIEEHNIALSDIPAVTHVDYSARVQTVHSQTNPLYYNLVREFYRLTGCPLVVNTSFNTHGQPIVCSVEHAYMCFMKTAMDNLILGSYILKKTDQVRLKGDPD